MAYAYELTDGTIAICNKQSSIPSGLKWIQLSVIPTDKTYRDSWKLGINSIELDQTKKNTQDLKDKLSELKSEALTRINIILPAIKDMDDLELVREQWLSLAPAARNPTVNFQKVIDIYQAGKDAITNVKSLTPAEILEYDVISNPNWPI